jgi:uncharacterized oxidoreductase
MNLRGNTILITGAGSGIGLGFADAFAQRGNEVIVAVRSPEKAETAARKGLAVEKADVSDLDSIQALAARVSKKYPTLNAVMNNAALSAFESFLEGIDIKRQEAIVVTNLLGYMRVSEAFLPHLLRQKAATIVNVSSALAFVPNAQQPSYCATKAGIHSFTQSLRYQLKDTHVEVIEIMPPYVQTSMLGEQQAHDPRAQPLGEFIDQAMAILEQEPHAREVVVERARALRFAADGGSKHYDAIYEQYNGRVPVSAGGRG